VTALKTQQLINLSAILASNFVIKNKKMKIGLKTWFCSVQLFWIEENADYAPTPIAKTTAIYNDEQCVIRQFLEPSKQNVKWLLVKPDLKWQLLARNAC
jgi:hypothetical protein